MAVLFKRLRGSREYEIIDNCYTLYPRLKTADSGDALRGGIRFGSLPRTMLLHAPSQLVYFLLKTFLQGYGGDKKETRNSYISIVAYLRRIQNPPLWVRALRAYWLLYDLSQRSRIGH